MEIIILTGWIIAAFIAGLIGIEKTIGFWGAFFLSLFFSPVIGLIVAIVSKSKTTAEIEAKVLKHQASLIEAEANSISSADEILKFKNLLDNGAITQEEFDAKKKQLLHS